MRTLEQVIHDNLPPIPMTMLEMDRVNRAIANELIVANGVMRDLAAPNPFNSYFAEDLRLFGEIQVSEVSIDAADPFERIFFRLHVKGTDRGTHEDAPAEETISIHVIIERVWNGPRVYASTYLAKYDF